MQSKSLSTIFVGIVVVFGVSYAVASRQGAVSKPDGSDWLHVDHDLAGTRYSPLKQITSKNVSHLAKVCAYSFPDKEPSQTAPIVSGFVGIYNMVAPDIGGGNTTVTVFRLGGK
jgi:hypothetical protein